MRSVKSRTYFEQMKGRGVRVIDDTDFQAVTPDAHGQGAVRDRRRGRRDRDRPRRHPAARPQAHRLARHACFKQISFGTLLAINGRAAIVVPDNVLFEGGAGETVRRKLLHECDVHTLLRLPTGIFYAQGVKANVLFFERKPASETPWTRTLWVYDLRTNMHFTLKQNQLRYQHLEGFIAAYQAEDRRERTESERFKPFAYAELLQRDKVSLDLIWLRDESLEDSANLPPPDVLAQEIVEDLEAALNEFAQVADSLRPVEGA